MASVSSLVLPNLSASLSTSADIWVVSSSMVMPQMLAYSLRMLTLVMLLSSLKMLICENFVMPVRNTKRRYGSQSFSGL